MMKAKYSEPCNCCGYCCTQQLCPVATSITQDISLPCPFLVSVNSSDFLFCNLVVMEKISGITPPMIQQILGIGCGCSCPDPDTTDEDIEDFDERSRIKVYGVQK